MLKKTITFEDFDGNDVTEDHYFHLSKAELAEIQLSYDGGLSTHLEAISNSKDGKAIIQAFKEIVKMAYGKRSDDGRRFMKNDEIYNDFAETNAYSEFMFELTTDANAGVEFIRGVMPAKVIEDAGITPDMTADDIRHRAIEKMQADRKPEVKTTKAPAKSTKASTKKS